MLLNLYTVFILFIGVLFFMAVVGALYWAQKTGQFRNFNKGARSIFTEDEPEGIMTDGFPGADEHISKPNNSAKN